MLYIREHMLSKLLKVMNLEKETIFFVRLHAHLKNYFMLG